LPDEGPDTFVLSFQPKSRVFVKAKVTVRHRRLHLIVPEVLEGE
jgi:hypothetical protein